jgi:glycosyltransferase involved in cell wall biosynthesis
MLDSLHRNYGVGHGRAISNGRDAADFVPAPKAPFIFAAGRVWDPAKNLLTLDQIAERLPWPVYVAGEPRQPGRDGAVTARHLQLLGQLPTRTVASWLRSASIYAFPARYEPFGLSVLEAALAGCALVLGDIPTLRELWDGAAIFVSPGQPETLQLALEGLIADPALRQALSMRARGRALTFTPRRMATAYLEVYTGLLTATHAPVQEAVCAP